MPTLIDSAWHSQVCSIQDGEACDCADCDCRSCLAARTPAEGPHFDTCDDAECQGACVCFMCNGRGYRDVSWEGMDGEADCDCPTGAYLRELESRRYRRAPADTWAEERCDV